MAIQCILRLEGAIFITAAVAQQQPLSRMILGAQQDVHELTDKLNDCWGEINVNIHYIYIMYHNVIFTTSIVNLSFQYTVVVFFSVLLFFLFLLSVL